MHRFAMPQALRSGLGLLVVLLAALGSGLWPAAARAQNPPSLTGTIAVTPSSGSYRVGDRFSAAVVLSGHGQRAFEVGATVTVSPTLAVEALTLGTCQLGFIFSDPPPTAAQPSFAAIVGADTTTAGCTAYTLRLRVTATGTGRISVSHASMLDGPRTMQPMLQGTTDGVYTLADSRTGTLGFYPYSGGHRVGETFQTTLYLSGNGVTFDRASAGVRVSSSLRVLGLVRGSCPVLVSSAPYNLLPTAANPSFGLVFGPEQSCTAYTLTLQVVATGTGQVSIASPTMSNNGGPDLVKATGDASYMLTP